MLQEVAAVAAVVRNQLEDVDGVEVVHPFQWK
jgi:hypothetical protein